MDEVILKVGKRKGSSKTFINSVRKDFLLRLTNPAFRHHVSTLSPEDLVDFVWKYFAGVDIPPEVIASKSFVPETLVLKLIPNHATF